MTEVRLVDRPIEDVIAGLREYFARANRIGAPAPVGALEAMRLIAHIETLEKERDAARLGALKEAAVLAEEEGVWDPDTDLDRAYNEGCEAAAKAIREEANVLSRTMPEGD